MDRAATCKLIRKTYSVDAIKQRVPVETAREVFCTVGSASQSEFYSAGAAGFKPEYKLILFAPDYEGETEVELDEVRYTVYRTFHGKRDDMELYLRKPVRADG